MSLEALHALRAAERAALLVEDAQEKRKILTVCKEVQNADFASDSAHLILDMLTEHHYKIAVMPQTNFEIYSKSMERSAKEKKQRSKRDKQFSFSEFRLSQIAKLEEARKLKQKSEQNIEKVEKPLFVQEEPIPSRSTESPLAEEAETRRQQRRSMMASVTLEPASVKEVLALAEISQTIPNIEMIKEMAAQKSEMPQDQFEGSTKDLETGNVEERKLGKANLKKIFGEDISSDVVRAEAFTLQSEDGSDEIKTKRKMRKFFGESVNLDEIMKESAEEDKTPWFLKKDYDSNSLIISSHSDEVRLGSLSGFVAYMTDPNQRDSTFENNFLLVFRSFCTDEEFWDALMARFWITEPEGLSTDNLKMWKEKKRDKIQENVMNILLRWITDFPWRPTSQICKLFRDFMEKVGKTPMVMSPPVKAIFSRVKAEYEYPKPLKPVDERDAPPAERPRASGSDLTFEKISPTELARQITIRDALFFHAIDFEAFLKKAWHKKKRHAQTLLDFIDYTNRLTNCISGVILQSKSPKATIKYFIRVGEELKALQNFNSLMAIIASFNSTPIYRLKSEWEAIGSKSKQSFNLLKQLFSDEDNFKTYRDMLANSSAPCIPFIGRYLTDITYIEDGNIDEKDGLINFEKFTKIASILRDIQRFRKESYHLIEVRSIQTFLKCETNNVFDEEALYNRSLRILPPKEVF